MIEERKGVYSTMDELKKSLRPANLKSTYMSLNKREEDTFKPRPKEQPDREERETRETPREDLRETQTPRNPIVEKKTVVKRPVRRDVLKWVEEEDEPLDIPTGEVVGGLLDREKFLKERVSQITEALETRKNIHKDIVEEIDRDIRDKEELMRKTSDLDEERDLKLDMSFLRAQKRKENVQFWKDVTQLRGQFKELQEELQMETKIANLFKRFDKGGVSDGK